VGLVWQLICAPPQANFLGQLLDNAAASQEEARSCFQSFLYLIELLEDLAMPLLSRMVGRTISVGEW